MKFLLRVHCILNRGDYNVGINKMVEVNRKGALLCRIKSPLISV